MQEASQSTLNPLNQTPLPGTNAGTITPSRPESFTSPSSSQNSWKRVRNDFLSTSAINNLEERNHVRTVEDKNKDKEIALARLNSTLQSGKLLGHQRTKLRQNFLAFALLLTVFIVTVLAGFGSVASREAQLQTAALLGESLIRNIRGDLSALKYYSEREIITLAIDFPNFYTLSNNITAIQGTKQMFAQLDSSEGVGVSSPLWGLYFANEDGLVVGVSRALKAGTTNTSMYECWGGNNGNTVRRTNASAVRCEASDLRHGQTNRGFRQYKYDARQRPWYKLAKSFPNQLVWTTPYVFSSTGYVGLTVALWAKTGIKYRTPIGEEKIAKGVFGIDITLTELETFLKTLAKSSQSANTFGSFPAELSLLINKTKLGKDQRYEVVVASTQEGKKMVQENVLDLNLQNKQNNLVFESIAQGGGSTSSKSMTGVPAQLKIYSNVTATSTSYFIFTHTVHFGGQDKDGWNGLVVGLLRRSNFLGSLELQSKTMYPFLAALIVLIIIPTTEYVTRKILKQTKQKTHHQDKDENDNQNTTKRNSLEKIQKITNRQIVSFSVATKKCCGRFNNELKLRMHLLLPVFVSIVVSTTCHLLIIIDNVGITLCLPFFLIVSKILLAALLHRSWLETATHHMGARFAKPSTSKFMAVVLLIWIIGSSISIICSYNGILQLKILQVGIEIGMFASLAYVIKGDHHTEAHAIVIAKRNVTPLRLVFVGVVVLGFLFTCLDAFQVSPYFFINDWNGPIYLIPALVSVMALSIAAKLDHPVRSIWPRPHLTIYLIVLTTILVWIVPWIIKTVCTFWHSLDSYNGLAQSMGFDLGFIVNFVWTVCVFLLSLFSGFFIDTGAMPAMGIGVHFGLTLFRSFVTTLLFLAVKPLDLGFYILLLFQCLQKIAIGLGIKNVIYDRYLSRTLWKSDPETYVGVICFWTSTPLLFVTCTNFSLFFY